MSHVITMKATQFTDFVRFLKRISDISDDFLIHNNIWIPTTRCPESRPGKHVIEGFPIPEQYSNIIYQCKNIRITGKQLGDITGKKGVISLNINENEIFMIVAEIPYLIAVATKNPVESFPQEESTFDELVSSFTWTKLSAEKVNAIKRGGVHELSDAEGNICRVTKSLFRLKGVERADQPAKYSVEYYSTRGDNGLQMLMLLVSYNIGRVIHTYICAPYTKPNYEGKFTDIGGTK